MSTFSEGSRILKSCRDALAPSCKYRRKSSHKHHPCSDLHRDRYSHCRRYNDSSQTHRKRQRSRWFHSWLHYTDSRHSLDHKPDEAGHYNRRLRDSQDRKCCLYTARSDDRRQRAGCHRPAHDQSVSNRRRKAALRGQRGAHRDQFHRWQRNRSRRDIACLVYNAGPQPESCARQRPSKTHVTGTQRPSAHVDPSAQSSSSVHRSWHCVLRFASASAASVAALASSSVTDVSPPRSGSIMASTGVGIGRSGNTNASDVRRPKSGRRDVSMSKSASGCEIRGYGGGSSKTSNPPQNKRA